MQKTNLKFLTCLTVTVASLMTSVEAQLVIPIFGPTDKSWQYYQQGNEPAPISGANWKATNYNDSAWSSGFGVFAYEDTQGTYPAFNTTLSRTYDGVNTNITYYFRTHFSFPTNPANISLYFTNLIDDGCVAYLNGTEIYRFRVTGTPPTWGTRASGGPAAEGTNEVVTLFNSTLLRQGDNVVAVELHDGGVGSSDVVWGLGLAYSLAEPIVITRHPPAKIAAVAFDDVNLAVENTGTNPRYWWFRNNVFLANQTNRVLSLANIAVTSEGTYHCVVSNNFSGARSSNSVVTVVPDTFGPRLLGAYVEADETNRIILQFNEDINRGAATLQISGNNTNNYFVSILGQTNATNRLPVALAQTGVGNGQVRVTLGITNFNKATNYQLGIFSLGDTRNNGIAVNSWVPLAFEAETNMFSYQAAWMYNEWGIALDDVNWKVVNYPEDPLYWFETAGMFANEQSGLVNPPCTLHGWLMSLGPNTYYFRKKFIVTTNVLTATNIIASIGMVADDGAVAYLNGTEIFRINMPPAPTPIFYDTRTPSQGNPNVCVVNEIQVAHLLGRTNVLAVEVHQFGDSVIGTDRRSAFDASLSLKYRRFPNLPQPAPNTVRIRTTNHSPTQVSVYFTNGFGYAIQSKTNLTEPWREVQPPTNRLIVPKAGPRQFYRLEKSH